jgi:GT2 family glycosyltransferase
MISVIIVTYNSRQWIDQCLESLRNQAAEVIVVDNDSADATVEMVGRFSGVRLLPAERNLGFAAACNLGARHSRGDALLFLNPDAICRTSLRPLEGVLAHSPGIAAVAPRLVDSQGRFQAGFSVRRLPTPIALVFELLLLNRLFPRNPVNRRYRCLDFDPDRESEVEQPAGACLLVRRSSFEACGGFDERFFPLWFEDVDLCLRLRRRGEAIWYCPAVRVEHSGGHSLLTVNFSEKQVYWYRNLLYYVRKHFGWGARLGVRMALFAGAGCRIAAELIAAALNRKTPARVRAQRVYAYWRAAMLSLSWGRG